MNYEESIAYLEAAASFGIKPGLERIEAILERLDHPEKAYKVIHVTGTNGKGSVVAMITSVLENATLKVGRYISPHLIDYTERIHIAGHDISKEDFAKAATVVREAAEKAIADGIEAPTEFELLTAMAFWYFKEHECSDVPREIPRQESGGDRTSESRYHQRGHPCRHRSPACAAEAAEKRSA